MTMKHEVALWTSKEMRDDVAPRLHNITCVREKNTHTINKYQNGARIRRQIDEKGDFDRKKTESYTTRHT